MSTVKKRPSVNFNILYDFDKCGPQINVARGFGRRGKQTNKKTGKEAVSAGVVMRSSEELLEMGLGNSS